MAIEKGHKEAKKNLAIMYGEWEKYDKATTLFKELGMTDGNGMYYTAMYYRTHKKVLIWENQNLLLGWGI